MVEYLYRSSKNLSPSAMLLQEPDKNENGVLLLYQGWICQILHFSSFDSQIVYALL